MNDWIIKYSSRDAKVPDGWEFCLLHGHHGANGYGVLKQKMEQNFFRDIEKIVKDRARNYDNAYDNHQRIAKGWSQILGTDITPNQVILCMVWTKISRLLHNPKHQDSIKDIAGYAYCLHEIEKKMSKMSR